MRIGLNLPRGVSGADDRSFIRHAAVAAEAAGYHSLWMLDRNLEPISALTEAAAATEHLTLGASVPVSAPSSPQFLVDSLTGLDRVSNGRLLVGLGTGWSIDEYESAGVPLHERGVLLDETLDVLAHAWRHGGPPVLLGGLTPKALDRVALRSDGWTIGGLPPVFIGPMWNSIRDRAALFGRNGDALRLVVRANIQLTEHPIDLDRVAWTGSPEQVAEDIHATRRLGAHELILGLGTSAGTLDDVMAMADELAIAADLEVRSLLAGV